MTLKLITFKDPLFPFLGIKLINRIIILTLFGEILPTLVIFQTNCNHTQSSWN